MNNSQYLMSGRASGRTSRMILEAFEQSKNGFSVCVLCEKRSKQSIETLAKNLALSNDFPVSELGKSVAFETPDSIGGIHQVDWRDMRVTRLPSSVRLVVDHLIYETEFKHILRGYHLYDEPTQIE